jgi:VCBS repeat-containing protein
VVQEDSAEEFTATGQFTVDDIDINLAEGPTWSFVSSEICECDEVTGIVTMSSEYGSMSVDQKGRWTYQLDNTSSKVNALAGGKTATDVFTIQVTDENEAVATKDVTITINGADEFGITAPISIDLDGNGISYVGRAAGVRHDYANNGQAVSTAWVAPNDGLLALMTESGALNIVFSTQDGETDLQGLAKTYDLNRDNILDVNDAQFDQFGVWQDADSDGIEDAGEYLTLAQRSIQSLSLTSDGKIQYAAEGEVVIFGDASYTTTDGQQHLIQDVGFATGALTAAPNEKLDFATIISQADKHQSSITSNTANTPENNSLTFALGGELFTVAVNNDQLDSALAMYPYSSSSSANNASGSAAWTEVVDITGTRGGPSSISAETGAQLNNGFSDEAGDWTVIVKSGTATVDAAKNQITFTSDLTENAVTIVNADGSSHDINNVDKIAWQG